MIDETRYTETAFHTETRPRFSVAPGYGPGIAAEGIDDGRPAMRAVAWGPIWAGVVVAIAVQAILAVLGMAIGLSVVRGVDGVSEGLGVGAGIWWVLTGIISLFLGGWTAGWLAAPLDSSIGGLHGFLTWCTVAVLSVALMATVGGAFLGGGLGMMTSGTTSGVRQNDLPRAIDTPAARNEINDAVAPDRSLAPDRAAPSHITVERATRQSAGVSWWSFIGLVLGAGAATIGGSIGRPISDEEKVRYRSES